MIKKNLIKTSLITMTALTLALGMTACGSKKNTTVNTDNTATAKAVVQEQTTKSQTEATTTTEPTSEEAATEAETATEDITEVTEATEAVEVAVNDTQEDTNIEAPVETPVEEPVYADTPAEPTPEPTPEPQPEAPAPAEPAPVVYTKDNPLVIKVANSVEVKTKNGECLGVGHSPVLHYMGYPHWVGDDGYVHTICPLCGNEVVQKLNGVGDYDNYNFDGTYHNCWL